MGQIKFGPRGDGLRLAYRKTEGSGPTIVFLPGYMSDMAGGKATAVFDWASANDRACLLLDYAGCGQSDGDFADQTLSGWRDGIIAMLDALAPGPLLLIGSSMGGWLMLMLAEKLGTRVAGLVGIAAAPDFTRWGYSDAQRAEIAERGVVYEDNPYGPEATPTWKPFFDDAEANLMLERTIAIDAPVRLLHGQADADVPWEISLRLASALRSTDARVTLVKDGDHRLSREADIALLLRLIADLI